MASYRITGGDGREYGPADADTVRRWLAEGRLNGRSLLRAEGGGDWRPLAEFPEFAAGLGSSEGAAPPPEAPQPPVSATAFMEQVLSRQPQVQIGRCLSRAWTLWMDNLGLFGGATLLVWLVGLCHFVPFLSLIYRVIAGALYGGLYLVVLKRIRGQPATATEAFAGFSLAFGQLVLAGFISSLLAGLAAICLLIVPGIYLAIAWVFSVPLVADKRLEFWSAMELSRKVVTRVWFDVFGLVMLAFLPVVLATIFTGMKVSMFAFSNLGDIIRSGQPDPGQIARMMTQVFKTSFRVELLTRVVLLANLPFAIGALMYAYEDLFGTRRAPTA